MAKKGQRQLFSLQCTVCKNRNYITSKNVNNTHDKLALEKFCSTCRQTTDHKEAKA